MLLVDDDETIRYALSETLKNEFEVLEADGVNDALKKLETTSVDLICSDYNMQDGTGLDLLHSCKERNISVPFMLMSAYDFNQLSKKADLYGITFCEKTDCEFLDKIRAML
ncbi:response regulator [Longicatena caecimuris]|uniref:response regulator n=1 Tax=Longicatena caecimuris TaxID=1796635 RepID=UPI001D01BA16|nr:response regulator [Longicatena caecimuris]MCB5393734.1 response regulator [Longicatena caecimuris]MCB5564689.1 response regulator [Longicatena caecimuris]